MGDIKAEDAENEEMTNDEPWPEQISKDTMYFMKSKQMDFIKKHKAPEIVSNLQHRLDLTNKAIDREVKKCGKYGKAIDVMFKQYKVMGHNHGQNLTGLNANKSNKVIEKEIFQTLQTLESRNIVTRQ